MIISTMERSYILRKRKETYLLLYDKEEDEVKAAELLDKIEVIENELERLAPKY